MMTRHRTPYRVIQRHHVSYAPEEIRHIYRIEHRIITWLNRIAKSRCSKYFLSALQSFIPTHIDEALSETQMQALYLLNQAAKAERRKQKKLHVRRSK